ncbi:MAG: hypothetical protein IPL19_10515 [Sandaracinaceae bacterium]|jgi:hypothetical protein|nr:hypothetical protein [Sandaracinaceae bacterium]MBP7684677.1 hypothetical protein [Deltaproteobacteria bacterium]MBK7153196.1 hypothetical protein [Sandaracinaceae bacterium]MBK7775132.1 hypothetical protein [Sandaracinaceae bacterium]MBK8408400.1 hypothetical protein [Sandaracinaceae bacterium]
MPRTAATLTLLVLLGLLAGHARAQPVNITLSRLRFPAGSPEAMAAAPLACQGGAYCADFDGYRALMAQLGGAVAPALLQPARTLGSRHFYVGVSASIAGLDEKARYWRLGTEGPASSTLDGGNPSPDVALGSYAVAFRQGLPFGLQFGADVGHVARSNLWVWGVEGQWALLEGYRRGPLAYLPDIALRFAVRTLTGDSEFTLIVPAIELVASKPFTLSSTTVLTPIVGTQLFWVVARTGSVDLSPDQPAVGSGGCDPARPSLDPTDNSPFPFGGCGAGDSAAFADNVSFPRVTARRLRATLGLNLRHRALVVGGAFQVDLSRPSGLGSPVPGQVPRQWSAQLSTGLTY